MCSASPDSIEISLKLSPFRTTNNYLPVWEILTENIRAFCSFAVCTCVCVCATACQMAKFPHFSSPRPPLNGRSAKAGALFNLQPLNSYSQKSQGSGKGTRFCNRKCANSANLFNADTTPLPGGFRGPKAHKGWNYWTYYREKKSKWLSCPREHFPLSSLFEHFLPSSRGFFKLTSGSLFSTLEWAMLRLDLACGSDRCLKWNSVPPLPASCNERERIEICEFKSRAQSNLNN